MKLSFVALFAVLSTQVSAFAPVKPSSQVSPLAESSMLEPDTDASSVEAAVPVAPPTPKMSPSMPFMELNPVLDGSIPGDVGFDPVGFAKSRSDLINYREAEIKHGRLAMLAAAGWPISELADKSIAKALSLPALVDASDRAPSVLNGGLGKVSPIYWAAVLALAAAIDVYGINVAKSNDAGYFPGNLGFDPLGLYPKSEKEQFEMQLKEIKNGRLAMIAIVGFAGQEFIRQAGVVDTSSAFFKPVGVVMKEYANAGYYIPDSV